MLLMGVTLLFLLCGGLCSCAQPSRGQTTSRPLSAGFWLWQDGAADVEALGLPVDVLFVRAGEIRKESGAAMIRINGEWPVWASLARPLPPARELWLVFRSESSQLPGPNVPADLAAAVARVRREGRRSGVDIAGIQLDIDCPTGNLKAYAAFLADVRRALPPELKLSITALLDWFREGTNVSDVVAAVDEFVPQFYDVGGEGNRLQEGAVSTVIDPAVWGPRLNRFGKPFRIGIAAFGRARIQKAADGRGTASRLWLFHNDLTPETFASNPAFELETGRRPSGERLLVYRPKRPLHVGWERFEPGDSVQFTLPTPEAIAAATSAARRIGGHLVGLIYFRWPNAGEALALQPGEVLRAAGFLTGPPPKREILRSIDRGCAAVGCADLYLQDAAPTSERPVRFRIHVSAEIEYILPEKGVPLRLTGPRQLEIVLPAFSGRGRQYLGRVVTPESARFEIEEVR